MPVSTARAARELRQRFPDLRTSYQELSDIIAHEAVDMGLDVEFSGSTEH
jgi:hypothetical protein